MNVDGTLEDAIGADLLRREGMVAAEQESDD